MDIDRNDKPYKLGVALSGGGSRGLAHAGALKALEEAGLRPDVLAGVSAGSVIAVMYSAGISPDDILKLFTDKKFSDFAELSISKSGFLRIDRFANHILHAISPYRNIEDLPIPTHIGVTNFDMGTAEEFHSGEIKPIMTASCSIPVAIRPVVYHGTTYVDGGVLSNLPAWTIRDKCQRLIGINVSPAINRKFQNSIFGVALHTYYLMAKSNQKKDMDLCDLVVLTREISEHSVFSLRQIQEVFNSGYENTIKALQQAGWTGTPSALS